MPLGQATASATGQGSAAASTRGSHDQLALSRILLFRKTFDDDGEGGCGGGCCFLRSALLRGKLIFARKPWLSPSLKELTPPVICLCSLDLINPDSISPETRSAGEEMIFKWQQHRRSIFIYNQTRDHFHWHHYQPKSSLWRLFWPPCCRLLCAPFNYPST